MSDILASVSVVLGAEISGFRAAMANARKELSGLVKFSEGLKDIGTSLTQYVTAPLALFSGAAVAASGKIESLKKGIEAITLQELSKEGVTGLTALRAASEQTTARMAELEQVAKRPGLGFEGAVQGDVRLRAVGISAEQSAKSIAAFANAIATTGGGKSEFDRVTVQLAQLSAKGKVLAQDLRPIIEAAPAVSGALQRLYGTVDSETISASLAKQGKSSTDFIAVLTDELAKLPQVSGGLKNAFENLADTGTLALAKFGDGISQALNLPGVLAGVSNFVERAASAFASLTPGTKTLIVALGGIAAAVGPVLVAVGTLGAALPAITAGFEVLGIESVAALGPILPVAAAVGAAAFLIYDNWSSIAAYFRSSEVTGLFDGLADAARSVVAAVGGAFDTIRANVGGNLAEMVSAATIFRTVFREAVVGVTAVLDVLAGSVKGINGLLTGDTVSAVEGAKQAFFGLVDPIANLFGFSKKAPTDSGIYVLTQQAKEFNAVGPQFAANLALLNNVRLDTIAQQAGEAAKQVGLLADLEARLKDAKATKEAATTEADIATSNQLIASLEAQIKRLNELGVGSDAAQKALTKLREEMALNVKFSTAFGASYDYIKERSATLKKGIESLIEAGFSPLSKTVQGLVTDMGKLYEKMALVVPAVKVPKIAPPEVLPMDLTNLEVDAESLGAAYDKMAAKAKEKTPVFTQAMRDFNTESEQILNQLKDNLINGISGIGEAIGGAVFNGTSVGSALASAFSPIIEALADFAAKKGKLYIALGIADLAIPGLQAQGIAEIAGGTALLLAAGVAKAGAGALAASARPSSAGGGLSTSAASAPRAYTPTTAPGAAIQGGGGTYVHNIKVEIAGSNLVGVLALTTDKLGRVVGKR